MTSDVPTSAPSITASAGAVAISPWPANAATISAVAVLLWISPVTPTPAKKAAIRLSTLCRSRRRSGPPYTRRIPVRTMCVPQTSSDTPASRLRSVCIRFLLSRLDRGERRVEDPKGARRDRQAQ